MTEREYGLSRSKRVRMEKTAAAMRARATPAQKSARERWRLTKEEKQMTLAALQRSIDAAQEYRGKMPPNTETEHADMIKRYNNRVA